MRPYLALLAILSLAALPLAARADTVTLTETFTGIGSIGYNPYTTPFDTTVTISTTFSSGAVTPGEYEYIDSGSLLTYTISGLGTYTSEEPGTFVALNQYGSSVADEGNLTIGNLYSHNTLVSTDSSFFYNPNGTSLSLITPFTTTGDNSTGGGDYTTGGSLTFTSVENVTVTLTSTPEPSSFALLGTGILTLAGVARRKMATR